MCHLGAIDDACFEEGVSEERFSMTPWHAAEAVEDVMEFLWWSTCHEDFEAERQAIVLIGADDALEEDPGTSGLSGASRCRTARCLRRLTASRRCRRHPGVRASP